MKDGQPVVSATGLLSERTLQSDPTDQLRRFLVAARAARVSFHPFKPILEGGLDAVELI